MTRHHLILSLSRICCLRQRRVTLSQPNPAALLGLARCYSSEKRSVADRFSWLLTESNQSGVGRSLSTRPTPIERGLLRPMISLDQLLKEWKEDSKINEVELDVSSLESPILHPKYVDSLYGLKNNNGSYPEASNRFQRPDEGITRNT